MKTLDQLTAEIVALQGDSTKLTAGAKVSTDLVTAANEISRISGELATANGQVASLTGDKTKLVAGATLPTDLVAGANSIAAITKERDDAKAAVTKLEGEKVSFDAAVAKELAKHGIVGNAKEDKKPEAGAKAPTATERVLAAHGVKTLAELEAKHKAQLNGGAKV